MSRPIKRILVSQPKPLNPKSPYYQIIEEKGIEIDFKPFFTIEPVSVRFFRDQKIDILEHTAVILSSRTMADHFFSILKELRMELPDDFKYFCSSEIVSLYLQKFITVRKRKIFFPEKSSSTPDLASLVKKHNKEFYFVPTTEGHRDDLFSVMNEKNIHYTQGVLSKVVHTDFTDGEIEAYDMIIFFSPNGVNSLLANRPDYHQGEQHIGCLGEGTLRQIEESGLRADLAVPNKNFQSITEALNHYLTHLKSSTHA